MEQDVWSWGRDAWLAALWLLAPLALFLLVALRSRARALGQLLLAGVLVGRASSRLHGLRLGLTLVGLALCTLALAQPRWGYQWRQVKQEGLNLAVVLDVSRSMDAQDVDPDRIERARRELYDLADLLRGDRIGLVLAAGGAYPRMPLTLDTDAFRQIVRDSTTSTLKAQGSDLGRAIDVAAEMLGPAGTADRALLIVSDGEDQLGQALDAARRAAADGVHIYTLGVGTADGAPIPLADGGFKKDDAGRVVLTRLDRDLLQQLAEIGSGAYADSVAGDSDIQAIYVDGIRGGLKTAEQGVRREKIWQERYQIPLGAGLALLLVAAGLRPRRAAARGMARTAAGLLLAAGLLATSGPGRAQQEDPVDRLLAQQVEDPDDMDLAERLGQALYEQGDFNRAQEVLTGVAQRSTDPAQRQRARTNAGLAAYRAGRLTHAVEAWDRVVQEVPDDPIAAANAEAVRQEIAQRMQEQQEQQESGRQGEQGEPQDGQQGEPQDGQQGEPQDGQQGEPQADQQPPDSDGARDGDAEPGQEEPQGDGELTPAGGVAEGDADTGAGEEGEVAVHRPGSMSEQEADRLLEGVEEGSPRVELDPEARRGGKDW